MHREGHLLLGIGNGMAAGALWGFVFLAPQVLPGFSAAQMSAARYLIYGAVALLLLAPGWSVVRRLGKSDWLALVWLSLLGNILYFVLLGQAVQLAGGAATSLIVGLVPVVVTLVGAKEAHAVKLHRLLPPLLLCCIGVGLIGVQAFQAGGPETDSTGKLMGFLCAFGALASWAAYAIGNSRYLMRLSHISAHDWSLLTGVVTGALAVVLGAFAFPMETTSHSSADWLRFWGVSAGVAIFASIVGNRFWNQASRLLPLTLVGQMIIFETLFALLYSFLWVQRWPTGLEALAIICLTVGIGWCASAHRPAPEAASVSRAEASREPVH